MKDNLEEYIIPTRYGTALVEGLLRVSKKLGDPTDLSTNAGWALLDNIIQVWTKSFPEEVESWKHDRSFDLQTERTIQEHVKGGTYNPITYPPALYHLIKTMFPDIRLGADKKLHKQLTERYPLFKTTNFKL